MATGLYVKLDASYHLDDKVADLSPEAELLWVRVLCHCKRLGNDGFVHRNVLASIAPTFSKPSPTKMMAELVDVGLMDVCDRGWMVAAWLRHNPSPEDIDNVREQARLRKQRQRDKQRAERASRDTSRNGHSVTGHASRDQPEPEPEPEPEKNYSVRRSAELTTHDPAQSAGKPSRRRQFPADLTLTAERAQYARDKGVTDPQGEWEHFADYHRGKGTVANDWDATWRTWCRNAVKFAARRPGLAVVNGGQPAPVVSKSVQAFLNVAAKQAGAK